MTINGEVDAEYGPYFGERHWAGAEQWAWGALETLKFLGWTDTEYQENGSLDITVANSFEVLHSMSSPLGRPAGYRTLTQRVSLHDKSVPFVWFESEDGTRVECQPRPGDVRDFDSYQWGRGSGDTLDALGWTCIVAIRVEHPSYETTHIFSEDPDAVPHPPME